MRVGRAVGRDVGALRDKSEMREIRTPDWKCNRSRLKVKWRRVRLGVAGRNRIRYGMVVTKIEDAYLASCKFEATPSCVEFGNQMRNDISEGLKVAELLQQRYGAI